MIVLRIIGRLLIILAMITLILGLAVWLFGADLTQPTGKAWFQAHVASLNFTQVIIQRHLHLPGLWDNVVVPYLLKRPVWESITIVFVVLLVLGGIFIRIGRPRLRKPGLG
jgi:hypothetical protein